MELVKLWRPSSKKLGCYSSDPVYKRCQKLRRILSDHLLEMAFEYCVNYSWISLHKQPPTLYILKDKVHLTKSLRLRRAEKVGCNFVFLI